MGAFSKHFPLPKVQLFCSALRRCLLHRFSFSFPSLPRGEERKNMRKVQIHIPEAQNLYPNFHQMDFHIPKSLFAHTSAAERWQTSRYSHLQETWLCASTGTSSLSAAVIRNPGQPGEAACLESTWDKPTHSFVAVRRSSLVRCGYLVYTQKFHVLIILTLQKYKLPLKEWVLKTKRMIS